MKNTYTTIARFIKKEIVKKSKTKKIKQYTNKTKHQILNDLFDQMIKNAGYLYDKRKGKYYKHKTEIIEAGKTKDIISMDMMFDDVGRVMFVPTSEKVKNKDKASGISIDIEQMGRKTDYAPIVISQSIKSKF